MGEIMTCSFQNCGMPIRTKGLCTAHYTQLLRGEQLRPRRVIIRDLNARLDAKIEKGPGCWSWIGAHANTGYAQVRSDKRLHYVHRLMYERANGPIPAGMVVDHMCHNRGCVNPAHMQAVTNKQNIENRAGASKRSTTGVRGVSYDKARKKYYGCVAEYGRVYRAGTFDTLEEAAAATSRKRAEVFTNSLMDDPAAPGEAD